MYSNNFNFRSREKYSIEGEREKERERERGARRGGFRFDHPSAVYLFAHFSWKEESRGEWASHERGRHRCSEEDDNGRDVTWYGAKSFRVSSCVHLRPPIMLIVLIVSLTRLLAVVYAQ